MSSERRAFRVPPLAGCSLAMWTEGAGPPVLWIQGTGLHGAGWLPQIEALCDEFACLWFDNRGIGQSTPRGSAPITVEQMAADAAAVLDHAGWDRAHVVGHSLGGCIALELALAHPARVSSLALLCTAADGAGLVRMDASMLWRGLRTQLGTRAARRRAFLEMVLTPSEHSAADLERVARELEPWFGHDLAVQPPIVMKQVRAMAKWNATDRLEALARVPITVVGAGLDVIAKPPLVRALAGGIPGAELVEWTDAAHGVPLTSPERVNDLLRRHLRTAVGLVQDAQPA